jgi:hypothetical protein
MSCGVHSYQPNDCPICRAAWAITDAEIAARRGPVDVPDNKNDQRTDDGRFVAVLHLLSADERRDRKREQTREAMKRYREARRAG